VHHHIVLHMLGK